MTIKFLITKVIAFLYILENSFESIVESTYFTFQQNNQLSRNTFDMNCARTIEGTCCCGMRKSEASVNACTCSKEGVQVL